MTVGQQQAGSSEIRLIVRGDDMGVAHAANEACVQAYRNGIMRSVEMMVPGAWFLEAARMCNENPGLDVGVHLTLTSEWELCKWRPLTHAPSLVDADGYFYPMTSQRADFPPNTGFIEAGPKLDELEHELRAQIEMAKKHIKNVTHLSSHMGAPTCMPPFREITQRLSKEYALPLEVEGAKWAGGFDGAQTPAEKEAKLAENLMKLTPGLWLFIDHPGLDVPEMQAMGHKGYWGVAQDREGVTRAFCSEKVKQVIRQKQIKLISYAEAWKDRR